MIPAPGGVRRLDWVLEGRDVAVLILALGANDGFSGLPPSEMKKNLATIIEQAKSRGIQVHLAGFEAPPDAKERYVRDFVAVFPELSRENDVPPHALHPRGRRSRRGRSGSRRNGSAGRRAPDEERRTRKRGDESARVKRAGPSG